jgi:putative DNA primase/helicase
MEARGILAWAVQRCLEWQRDGLDRPSSLVDAVHEYQAGQNIVGQFIAECCDTGAERSGQARPLYAAFREYASVRGESAMSETAFGKRLSEMSYATVRTRAGVLRKGLELKQ